MNNMMQKKTAGNDLTSLVTSDAMKRQWALVLPKCLTPDRMARIALSQLRKTPKLGQCTQESVLASLMTCAELGVEPNGRDAHLIPYGKECTLIIDYKGLVRLVRRDPSVKDVQVFTVRQNDDFKWTPEGIEHTYSLTADRGEVVGVYTKISWENGTTSYGEPMTKMEAEAIKKGSRAGVSGPWVSHFNEMWKKSVIRRDSKMWPLSPEIQDGFDADADSPIKMFANATASGAVYDEPALPAAHEEKEEPKAKKPAAPVATPAPDNELTPVADMDKSALKAEVGTHKDATYFAAVLDSCKLGDSLDWGKYPPSALRDFVTDLRETQESQA